MLDEADRMLDMGGLIGLGGGGLWEAKVINLMRALALSAVGFEPQLQVLSRYVPRDRQTLFFSATWPHEVQSIARRCRIGN